MLKKSCKPASSSGASLASNCYELSLFAPSSSFFNKRREERTGRVLMVPVNKDPELLITAGPVFIMLSLMSMLLLISYNKFVTVSAAMSSSGSF